MNELPGRMLSESEQQLFQRFFAALKESSIPVVLLRNYEDFPARIGHDIDLFFRRQDVPQVKGMFLKLLAAQNGSVLVIHERDYFIDIRFVLNGSASQAIHLDVYHGAFTWHGLPYLLDDRLLAEIREFNGLPIPRPAHEAYNIFFASILWGGFYKARYQPRIATLLAAHEERAEFDRCVLEAFGPNGFPPFDPCAAAIPDKASVKQYAGKLRRAFKLQSLRQRPIRSLVGLARHWGVEVGCYLRPKGLVIAITGPDDHLTETISDGLIQRIGELFGERRVHRTAAQRDEQKALPASIRLMCTWIKCWLRWPARGWKQRGQSHLVLIERHAEDWWCVPSRYGFTNIPSLMLKIFARTAPRPDFTFFLVPTGHLTEPSRFQQWAANDSRCFLVASHLDEPAILDDLESILVTYLHQRDDSV